MGKHRAVRRLGALMAIPVAIFTVSTAFLISALTASAAVDITVSASPASCNTSPGRNTVTFTVTVTETVAEGDTWSNLDFVPSGATFQGLPSTGSPAQSFTATMTLPSGYTGPANLTVVAAPNLEQGFSEVTAGPCSTPPPTTSTTT